jgi:hypothetical protein
MPLLFLCLHVEPNRAKYIDAVICSYIRLYTDVVYVVSVSIYAWNQTEPNI